MTPDYQRDGVELHLGDCLEVLGQLPAESVDCCCTSPPYWGLRDYNVEGQLGLESTPDEYVKKMVEVFRAVRRVLKPTGTCWINLGSSYASGGMSPSQSPLLQRAPECGSDDKVSRHSQDGDRACPDSGDEHQGETLIHRADTVHNDLSSSQGEPPTSPTGRGSEHSGCGRALAGVSLPGAPPSTTPQSSAPPSAASSPSPTGEACQSESRTSSLSSHPSEHSSGDTSGNSWKSPPLVSRIRGKESFYSACGRSDCKGLGRCGLCWCSLAIPSLNVKAKDLVPIPWLVALALQADGWYLRQDIIWKKPNPMPESCTDRCTKAHEYVFLLTKQARYFFDAEAIKEPATYAGKLVKTNGADGMCDGYDGHRTREGLRRGVVVGDTRNKRSVWNIPTQSFPGAHFATFPEKLVEPMIKAGSSEKGVCPECGKPWTRVVETVTTPRRDYSGKHAQTDPHAAGRRILAGMRGARDAGGNHDSPFPAKRTIGWRPTCECYEILATSELTRGLPSDPSEWLREPATVLDPFAGSCTTGVVAHRFGRWFIGIELSPEYCKIARRRLDEQCDSMALLEGVA